MLMVFKALAFVAFLMLSACAAPMQASSDSMGKEIEKLKADNKILENALKRAKAQLPPDNAWPKVFSTGYYGEFWLSKSDQAQFEGKILEFKKSPGDTEEQIFIVPRISKKDPVLLEGKGLREIDAGVYGIVIYKPPQDPEERKKQQAIVITVSDTRFVVIFKPPRF